MTTITDHGGALRYRHTRALAVLCHDGTFLVRRAGERLWQPTARASSDELRSLDPGWEIEKRPLEEAR